MKHIRILLLISLLAVLMPVSFARDSLNLPTHLSSAKLQGSGRLTWWGYIFTMLLFIETVPYPHQSLRLICAIRNHFPESR